MHAERKVISIYELAYCLSFVADVLLVDVYMFKAIGLISSTYFARHSIVFDYSSEVNTYAHTVYDVVFTYLSKSLAIS